MHPPSLLPLFPLMGPSTFAARVRRSFSCRSPKGPLPEFMPRPRPRQGLSLCRLTVPIILSWGWLNVLKPWVRLSFFVEPATCLLRPVGFSQTRKEPKAVARRSSATLVAPSTACFRQRPHLELRFQVAAKSLAVTTSLFLKPQAATPKRCSSRSMPPPTQKVRPKQEPHSANQFLLA